MTRTITLATLLLFVGASRAERPKLSFESADARLRRVYSLARETNDSSLVERVLELRISCAARSDDRTWPPPSD